jgi:putative ABC transport system ATP-binding protein
MKHKDHAMQTDPLLEGRNLHKRFTVRGQTIEVLKGVDFVLHPGEVVVIRGRSGQGKSVLLWLLSGIDLPTAGEVRFEGVPYDRMSGAALATLRRERIGLLFQDFNLIPAWTALENVAAAMPGGERSRKERSDGAAALLDRMGLGDRLHNLPSELSIGQQQRVALARALINAPALILADEPTGNVDPETADELLALLRGFVRENRAALVVTTHGHFPGEADADRVLRLQDGVLCGAVPA